MGSPEKSPVACALVIGKFMPPHQGHMALIRYALARCGQVRVLVGALEGEPIPGPLRHDWMVRAWEEEARVVVDYTDEPLPTSAAADWGVSRAWAAYLKRRYPQATHIVSSEAYGRMVAEAMGIGWLDFDPDRGRVPVSATLIRNDPWTYWDFICEPARSYFVKRICFYGPESTGKTVMAQRCAERFRTVWVPEIARDKIDERGGFYPDMIAGILSDHALAIEAAARRARRWLFVDSDCLTTLIYSRHFFGSEIVIPDEVWRANQFDHRFLFDIDVPFVADPQRLGESERKRFLEIFRHELETRRLPYSPVRGSWEERFETILGVLTRL